MKMSVRRTLALLPLLFCIVGAISLFLNRHSILSALLILAIGASWSLASWKKSAILSEIVQCLVWGVLAIFSWQTGGSSSFDTLMFSGMLFLSLYVLRLAFLERKIP